MLTAFSPRKQAIRLYLSSEFKERDTLLKALGKHSCGAGCVYIKRLSDVHLADAEEAGQGVGQTYEEERLKEQRCASQLRRR